MCAGRKNQTIAVREISRLSRHHGEPIEGPPEIPRTSQHYRIGKEKKTVQEKKL